MPTKNFKHKNIAIPKPVKCCETCWCIYMMALRTLACYINKEHENTITKFQGISWWPREDAVAMGAALLAIEHNTWNWLAIMHASWIKYTKNERIAFCIKPDGNIKMESDIKQLFRLHQFIYLKQQPNFKKWNSW